MPYSYVPCKLLHAPPVWRWIMLAQAPHYVESFSVRQTTFPISLNKIAWIFGLFDTRSQRTRVSARPIPSYIQPEAATAKKKTEFQ